MLHSDEQRLLVRRIATAAAVLVAAVGIVLAPGATADADASVRCQNAVSISLPTSERRFCLAEPSDYPSYRGWSARTEHHCGFYPFNLYTACTDILMFHPGWEWIGGTAKYRKINVAEGEAVYIAPFTADWVWVYYGNYGWTAMRADDVTLYWSYPVD